MELALDFSQVHSFTVFFAPIVYRAMHRDAQPDAGVVVCAAADCDRDVSWDEFSGWKMGPIPLCRVWQQFFAGTHSVGKGSYSAFRLESPSFGLL